MQDLPPNETKSEDPAPTPVSEPTQAAPSVDHEPSIDSPSCVQVAVRVRPILPQESGQTCVLETFPASGSSATATDSDKNACNSVIRLGGAEGPRFTFDQVFDQQTPQHQVFDDQVVPLVQSCLEGYNATILAYGQTGSGKTHSMMGPSDSLATSVQDPLEQGVIPRAIQLLFEELTVLSNNTSQIVEIDVRIQFLEVYGEEIHDLLGNTNSSPVNTKLTIRDVGRNEPEVVGATEHPVCTPEEALLCLTRGMYRRVTGATAMNATSSRSHAIFTLMVEQSFKQDTNEAGNNDLCSSPSTASGNSTAPNSKRSKFHFVDLAGSERQKRTQSTGQRLKEGIDINKGLLVLGNVISALGDPKKRGKTFVPYRDSKLTRLLKGSLGGNHRTLMIACVSPSSNNLEETLNCLRYANRAKNIQNHAVVNVDANTRQLVDLQQKLQLLAADLLRAHNDGTVETCTIPLEIVESMAQGRYGDENGGVGGSGLPKFSAHLRTPSGSPTRTSRYSTPRRPRLEPDPIQEEELVRLRAENETFRLQVASSDDSEPRSDSSATPMKSSLQRVFAARALSYEQEISELKGRMLQQQNSITASIEGSARGTITDTSTNSSLPPRTPNRAPVTRCESPELSRLRTQMFGSMTASQNLDEEMKAEEAAVAALTTKYLRSHKKRRNAGVADRAGDDEEFSESQEEESEPWEEENDATSALRLEADLVELDSSINAKEDLILKLQASQEKYEAMRHFYQDKLRDMESMLHEKENETEKLSEELKTLSSEKQSSKSGRELAERLKEKREQVSALKKKQAELTKLTRVASRNESQISKLRNEVLDMKHKKVDLQKQITSERKSHLAEIGKLKKASAQTEKELNKAKRTMGQKTVEAERAQQMAKTRLEQMNHLKTKYKESEKRLRMQTVRRGVMSKAGLDPVMVGRRQLQQPKQEAKKGSLNIDGLRDLFDKKVSDVGRREALAQKLAEEWEEHLVLSIRREDVSNGAHSEEGESIEALESQISYKEDRIRKLASRLGKRIPTAEDDLLNNEPYLFDQEFKQLLGGTMSIGSTKTASKVLFGMVVRERRRIASLARTASSLDERVQHAESNLAAKDAAFRAYVEEQRHETATLAQNQQEHILSLMDMVREEAGENSSLPDDFPVAISPRSMRESIGGDGGNSKLLVLANERISVLERQLDESQLRREALDSHRDQEEQTKALLSEKSHESEYLQDEVDKLRAALQRIEEMLGSEILETNQNTDEIRGVLREAVQVDRSQRSRSQSTSKSHQSAALSRNLESEFGHSSDSDEVPDWADDIMADLAIIAEGKMPTALLMSPEVRMMAPAVLDDDENQSEGGNVFDRLTNPSSFTGTQKLKTTHRPKAIRKSKKPNSQGSEGQRNRKQMSKNISDSLDNLVVPVEDSGLYLGQGRNSHENISKGRSVFDRLLSPSNLTGTQKSRFHEKKDHHDSHVCSSEKESDFEYSPSMRQEDSQVVADGEENTLDANLSRSISRHDYMDLDVFERLNKTTTQAYAVKQHVNIAEKMLDDLLDETGVPWEEGDLHRDERKFDRVEAYTKQNVFERLQNTTTKAHNVKQNTNSAERMLDDILDHRESSSSLPMPSSPVGETVSVPQSAPQSMKGRLKQTVPQPSYDDVFERLQKTTTEAYAKKQFHAPGDRVFQDRDDAPQNDATTEFPAEQYDAASENVVSDAESTSKNAEADDILDEILDAEDDEITPDTRSPIVTRLRSRHR